MEKVKKTIEIKKFGRAHIDEALDEIAAILDDEFQESPRAVLKEIHIEKYWTRSTEYGPHFTYIFACEGWPHSDVEGEK